MADKQASYPTTVPLPPLSRAAEVAELLVGAIDLHCHSGPAAMPRILDHHEELLDAAAAKFRAVLYKDHFYAGMPHAIAPLAGALASDWSWVLRTGFSSALRITGNCCGLHA